MNSDSLSRQDFNLLPVAAQRIKYSLDGSTNTCKGCIEYVEAQEHLYALEICRKQGNTTILLLSDWSKQCLKPWEPSSLTRQSQAVTA